MLELDGEHLAHATVISHTRTFARIEQTIERAQAQYKVGSSRKIQAMATTLGGYLEKYRCPGGTSPSHTSLSGGSYDIPQPSYADFLSLYISALEQQIPQSLTEQPCLFFPLVADIDLAYHVDGVTLDTAEDDSALARVHGDDFVLEVASAFAEVVAAMGASPKSAHSIEVWVMQRPRPYVKAPGVVRDGLHLMVPNCIMSRPGQCIARRLALPLIAKALDRLPGQRYDAAESVDPCYCEKGTNWQMYGSSKPGRSPYLITHCVHVVVNQGERVSQRTSEIGDPRDWKRWVPATSVRQGSPDGAWALNADVAQQVDAVEEEWADKKFAALQNKGGFHDAGESGAGVAGLASASATANSDDAAKARELVKCLSPSRADQYDLWRNVGFALRNTSSALVDTWHEFSAQSRKYDRRVCQKFWDRLHPDQRAGPKLTLGSLFEWARTDNPEQVINLDRDEVDRLLKKAVAGNTHTDWGSYVCAILPNQLASVRSPGSGRGDRLLYVFENHRWRAEPCGTFIKNLLKGRVVNDVNNLAQQFPDDADLAKDIARAVTSLKTKGFRENVLGDVTETVADDQLLDKLDSHRHLIGWNNGVFDLVAQTFRPGEPEDYVTMSTGHDYLPPDCKAYAKATKEVRAFLEKLHVDAALRKYFLDSLAVMLSGTISFEHMHCWTGTGSNGKSRAVKLIDEGLGDYLKTLPPSLLTGARPESGKPTPELCSAAGARIVVMSEVDGKATINVAVMKELSGGDKIAVRALYGGSSTIKPQFTMIMTCNDLSKVDANDDGTWRRLKVLPYRSKFVMNNPTGDYEFKADNSMDDRLQSWAPYFISMLQARYPQALRDMKSEPPEITEQVRLYRVASDRDADFVNKNLILNNTASEDGEEYDDADAWILLDMYKREGRDRDITLSKLTEKLQRFGVSPPVVNASTGTATIPGYRIALRTRT